MKLVSFGPAGRERPGVLLDKDVIVDLDLASQGEIRTIRGLLEMGDAGRDLVAEWIAAGACLVPAAGVRLGPPVTNPSKIVCLGLNYRSHAEEQNTPFPERPLLFAKATTSLAGDGDPIWYPMEEGHLDYEAELAFVIGRPAFRVAPEAWESYVAGYTILNDVSARDAQFGDGKWFRGKSYDSCCPMGPYLVSREQIPDPHALRLTAHLNGELRQDGHTGDLIFPIPEILAFVTRNMTFVPGDIISTGTPCGVGIFHDPPACMNPGDEIVVSLEQVGTLTNVVRQRIADTPSVYPAPRL